MVWRSPERVRAAYAQSIRYSLGTLVSFLETYGDDDTVLVLLGDHQPATVVSGRGRRPRRAGHRRRPRPRGARPDRRLGLAAGLRPAPDAPVWRMDAFRDRFLAAFGS